MSSNVTNYERLEFSNGQISAENATWGAFRTFCFSEIFKDSLRISEILREIKSAKRASGIRYAG